MPTSNSRIARINEEVKKRLSELLRDIKDPRLGNGMMISVVRCDVTNDLRWCKAYISVLGQYDKKQVETGLKSASGFLRRELAHSLSLRYTPELIFILDDSISYGVHISKVLSELDIRSDEETKQD